MQTIFSDFLARFYIFNQDCTSCYVHVFTKINRASWWSFFFPNLSSPKTLWPYVPFLLVCVRWRYTLILHFLYVFQVPFKSKMSRPSNLIFWKIKNSNDVFRVRHNPSSSHYSNPFYKTLLCGFSLYVSAFIILFKKAVWLYHKLEVYMFFDFL